MPEPIQIDGLQRWRSIGPFRGGRVVAVAGSYHDDSTFYFGACAGGVWKSTDGGTYWRNVTDGYLTTSAVGALAVAPSDSNVIYAGTGETTIRIDVTHGDGVYRSTDAGHSWTHLGLSDTRFIGKIRVHPNDPDTVWVAALGHAFGPNTERGVFKSTDGGATWSHPLFVSERAGAVDLTLDANPRILYAGVWEAFRSFWMISSGGPDSGLWQSKDGGDTWTNISSRRGLPAGTWGKVGVSASPAQSGRVWALIEHRTEGGLYRSDDFGATWEKVSDDQNLLSRAWYYTHVTADPVDPDTVYVNNLSFWKSTDGGRTFTEIPTPHGDNHDVWIDPKDNRRMIQANDGGANVSYNGGRSFSSILNQPTAQFYHLCTDNRDPYTIYGTQQDNTSIAIPSRVAAPNITWSDCYVAGSGESGYLAIDPDDDDILYVGAIGSSPGGGNSLQRYDRRRDQIRLITTWPELGRGLGAESHKYRFAWTYPIVFSPHDPDTLYIGGNLVFKTTDEGQTWEAISPDLTRADPETLKVSGGPVNSDAVGAETYATVYSLVESPREKGTIWAGSDDGLVHITRDAGTTWANITPPDMLEWTMVTGIELSPFESGKAYLCGTRYKTDDYRPYVWVTNDYGATWSRIDHGLPDNEFTRVIRADPDVPGLLYLGTELGVHVSFDDGASWQSLQLNLPVAPVFELIIKEGDLIAGTHGRSIWIMDDLTPLRSIAQTGAPVGTQLIAPRNALRVLPGVDWSSAAPSNVNYFGGMGGGYDVERTPEGDTRKILLDSGENPPFGAVITYYLDDEPDQPISLSFTSQGAKTPLRTFTGRQPDDDPIAEELRVPAAKGWNRFVWNLTHPDPTRIDGDDAAAKESLSGPYVAPGRYTATLTVGKTSRSAAFDVINPPEAPVDPADLVAQEALSLRICNKVDEANKAVNRMRDLRGQLSRWETRTKDGKTTASLAKEASALSAKVRAIEETLAVPDLRMGWGDSINAGPRLIARIANIMGVVQMGDYRPTDAAEAATAELEALIDKQIRKFDKLVEKDVAAFAKKIEKAGIAAIVVL
ncbi:MAG: glycosyl hydrolase [Thermomicrobiales bacterium]